MMQLKKDAIKVKGILYAPPNFLRMSMYLELSRPRGDVSRWEKVLKRLLLLNRNYPLKKKSCDRMDIQRKMDTKRIDAKVVFDIIRNTVVENNGVFFGGYANALYSKFLPNKIQKKFKKIPDFDVLSEHPLKLSEEIQKKLQTSKFNKIRIYKHEGIGEIIAPHYEVAIDKETVVFLYEPLACHSYNVIKENNEDVRIATIDTMLSFYLAFLYSDRTYYDKDRILCMAKYLFEVQQHNRLKQESILKRFSMNCYGRQQTINRLREEKAEKYRQLKNQRGTAEYNEWFLKYNPGDIPTPKAHVKLPKGLRMIQSKKVTTRKGKKHKTPKHKTRTKKGK